MNFIYIVVMGIHIDTKWVNFFFKGLEFSFFEVSPQSDTGHYQLFFHVPFMHMKLGKECVFFNCLLLFYIITLQTLS